MNTRTYYYFTLALLLAFGSLGRAVFRALLGASVSKYTHKGKKTTKEVSVIIDHYGELLAVQNCYRAIDKARQVVVMRSGQNSTVIAIAQSESCSLLQPIGCRSISNLNRHNFLSSGFGDEAMACGNKHIQHHLLLTGLAGDCRQVLRFAQEAMLNHTYTHSSVPSGPFLAECIGNYMQQFTLMQSPRPLGCHAFLITTTGDLAHVDQSDRSTGFASRGTIFELHASGTVRQINAGCAGLHMEKGNRILRQEYDGPASMSMGKCQALINKMFSFNKASGGIVEGKEGNHDEPEPPADFFSLQSRGLRTIPICTAGEATAPPSNDISNCGRDGDINPSRRGETGYNSPFVTTRVSKPMDTQVAPYQLIVLKDT